MCVLNAPPHEPCHPNLQGDQELQGCLSHIQGRPESEQSWGHQGTEVGPLEDCFVFLIPREGVLWGMENLLEKEQPKEKKGARNVWVQQSS